MARIREAELRCAAAALGLDEVILLGLPDGRLADLAPVGLTAKLLGYFRSSKPTIMTFSTYVHEVQHDFFSGYSLLSVSACRSARW